MKVILKAILVIVTAARAAGVMAANEAAPAGAGVISAATETIVSQQPDGSIVTVVRPVKDIAGWFRSMGAPVPPVTPQQDICLPPVTVTPGGGGGGGGGGGYNGGGGDGGGGGNWPPVPPAQDAATAATLLPPVSVNSDPGVTTYTAGASFADGWSVSITWVRAKGPPPGPWFQTRLDWTPPGHGTGAGSTQAKCDEQAE
jgi:hypothetical protein